MTQDHTAIIRAGHKQRRTRQRLASGLLCFVVLGLCALMLIKGNTDYPLSVVFRVLRGEKIKGASYAIQTLRLPRMLTGLLAGIAFGMAGNVFQTMLKNPLASPDIIGITAGSSAAAVFCILMLHLSGSIVSFAALIAGLAVALFVYTMSRGGRFSGGRLILIGIGMQAMLNALISYMLLKGSEYDVPTALRWMRGSLNGVQMRDVPSLLIAVTVCGIGVMLLTRHLGILELGEDAATTLGLKTNPTRILLIICAVLLISFATAATGPVSFVAFLAGPIAKKLAGASIPAAAPSALVGAVLVLGADLIGQFAFTSRYPVGVVTGILGAPYLIFLLIRVNKKGGTA